MTTATIRPAPRRRNADQWRALLLRFEAGDLSPMDFCRREHLALSSFQRWRHRFAAPAPAPAAGFVELLLPAARAGDDNTWTVELDLPGGGSLRIRCR